MDAASYLTEYASLTGLELNDPIFSRALKLLREKGLQLNHIAAELLIYSHLKKKGFEYVSIEESVNGAKCDVYAEYGTFNLCVEIEFYTVPLEYLGKWSEYIIARHVKKFYQAAKALIKAVAFAYPYGLIPLAPIELLRPPQFRSREKLLNILSTARRFYPFDEDAIDILSNYCTYMVYIFDIGKAKVYEMLPQNVELMETLYISLFTS